MMKAKTWVIMRQETFNVTYVIEVKEEITEAEAKDLLFMDGLSAAEKFDRTWVKDSPPDEWETLGVPDDKTFRVAFKHDDYHLILCDKDKGN